MLWVPAPCVVVVERTAADSRVFPLYTPMQTRQKSPMKKATPPGSRRREFCHFGDTPLFIPIKTPTNRERGVQQNDSLVDGQRHRCQGSISWP